MASKDEPEEATYHEIAFLEVTLLRSVISMYFADFILQSDDDGRIFSFSASPEWEVPEDFPEMECSRVYVGSLPWQGYEDVSAKLCIAGGNPRKGWMELWRIEL